MNSSQEPVVAGLLTLVASAIAPSAATPHLASYPDRIHSALPTVTSAPSHTHHGDRRDNMHQWSSLIGIIAALAGNVLISVALNIQRYAHLRIAREWQHHKVQKEADWRRTHSVATRTTSYGSVGSDVSRGRTGRHGNHTEHFEPYNDGDDGVQSRENGASFTSDGTIRPADKNYGYGHRKSYLKSPYWWVGIVLMCLGETGNFLAYGFAPASIVSPLGVVALISNCVIAPCLLKEKFRQRDFWGVLVSVAGAVVVVLSAKSSEEKLGPDEIWRMITRWEFELYLGLTVALIIGLMSASYRYGARSILIDVGLVALFGGYTALSTKGVSSLLSFTLWHVITFPISYLLVFVLVFSALMQIRYINRALQRFDSTQVIPTQFVLFTLSVIVGSAILYRDFNSMSAARAGKFIGGCFLTFLGVYFITSGRVHPDDESTFSSDEEDSIGMLNGEQYHDRIDLSPPDRQTRASRVMHTDRDITGDAAQSPPESLLSRGIDEIDNDQLTPRGLLSAAPSSPTGSLTADSPLSRPSFERESPLRPPSRMSNPWANSHDGLTRMPISDAEVYRPLTPVGQAHGVNQESTVLLRFPPAPGIEDTSSPSSRATALRRVSTPATTDQPQPIDQTAVVLDTPTRRLLRNSISNRFSPGPLIPTISAGFSAVVAESLRRGEGSPFRDRSRRRLGRRRQLDPTFGDVIGRYQDGGLALPDDGDLNSNPLTLANARLQSATFAPPSAEAGRSTPALNTEIFTPPTRKPDEDITRLRSFSDSWSGGLAWLGGALRKSHNYPSADSVAATQGTMTPQNDQAPHSESGHNSANVDTDSRS